MAGMQGLENAVQALRTLPSLCVWSPEQPVSRAMCCMRPLDVLTCQSEVSPKNDEGAVSHQHPQGL